MKRIAWLLAVVLGSTVLAVAQSNGTEMTGVLCNAKCVKQDAGKAACDTKCSESSNDVVFVDDQGKATKVANPKMAKGKMGKKVKVRGEMMKDKDQDTMQLYEIFG